MAAKPLIAVTPSGYDYNIETASIKNLYTESVHEAGGVSIVVPITENEDVLENILGACSGLLLTGGPDIDAKYFGEFNLSVTGNISPYRDTSEFFLIRRAVELKKPILGICRGIQILNVALGGTLYQDIVSQLKGMDIGEHSQKAPRWYPYHEINIEEGSRIFKSFKNKKSVRVNSLHHQAIKDVAQGFIVTSRAMDGIVESIEHTRYGFVVGVQWHPEDMWPKDRMYLGIFNMFIESCKG